MEQFILLVFLNRLIGHFHCGLKCLSFMLVKVADIYSLPYQGILINGQFPGPTIDAITNDNIVVNVINKLDDHFLITWLVVPVSTIYFSHDKLGFFWE